MGEREHGWYHWVEKTVSIEVGSSLVLMVESFTGRVWYCKIISSPRLLLRLNSVQDKAFQRSRTCPSCSMNMPFFTLEHALLLSCLYLFDIVLVASLPFAHVALFSWGLLRVSVLSIFISLRGSLGILFLTDFHRWTEAFLLTGGAGREELAPPPSPPPKGGEWSPRYPYRVDGSFVMFLFSIYNSWNALCSLYAEDVLWARNVRQKALLTLWALWEKEILTVRERIIQEPC